MRDSFIIYTEYMDVLDSVTAEQAGLLIRAMVRYARDEAPVLEDPVVKAVFATIKPRMDKDREKWEQECERRAEAGRKGGLAKASNAKQSQAEPSKAKERLATLADNDPDCDYEDDNNPPKSPQRGKRESQMDMYDRLITGRAVNNEMAETLRAWIVYKVERNERYKEAGMRSLITQAVNHGAAHGADAVCSVIRESMANGYKGIVWDRMGKDPPKRRNIRPPERNYDMAALEKELLASN